MKTPYLFIASDHRGFALKNRLAALLRGKGYEVEDVGTDTEARCDASDFASLAIKKLRLTPESRAILICGSGQMMAITANRFKQVRAALCLFPEMAQMAREHNDANVLVLASDYTEPKLAEECVEAFLSGSFAGGRYADRLRKLLGLGGL